MPSQETYTIKGGLKIVEHFFDLPLDYADPDGQKIRVFARQSIPTEKAETPEEEAKLPFCGPGFECSLNGNSGFSAEIYNKGYQILWVDQRGTGLSTPLTSDTLPETVKNDEQIAKYLKHFRADSIVKDCESIRKILLGNKPNPEDQKWSLIGQSFGGFCCLTYLSFHPESLKQVFLTGGLAPLVDGPDKVYEALAVRVAKRNEVYYRKYPADIQRVKEIAAYLSKTQVRLPNGGQLTVARFQQLGLSFGMQELVLGASNDLSLFAKIGYKTLQSIEQAQSFDGNPLYAILHEAIYCQGNTASNWSALRALESHAQFQWNSITGEPFQGDKLYFTGEMVFPSMFNDYANLRPWKHAANILAREASWSPLYDLEQLAKNEVKVSSVTYFNDMYVDFNLAQETVSKVANVEQYITNQLVHDGLRQDGTDVIKKLFQLSNREFD
ncbi:alpha/beta-hydrolase [Coprinopsis sp. MPI-PUGE-AT-0042]|nr:alpha/beta-hydrolase [Coprinopsis sp. MPI-PUGE-AT-0042]